MNCPHCGNWQPVDAEICGVCGDELDADPDTDSGEDGDGESGAVGGGESASADGGTESLKMEGLWESNAQEASDGETGRMSWTIGGSGETEPTSTGDSPSADTYVLDEEDEETTENLEMTEVLDLRAQRQAEELDAEESNWSEVRIEELGGEEEPDEFTGPYAVVSSPAGVSGEAQRVAIELSTDELVLGRARGPELLRKDPFLSYRHARIRRDGDEFILEDLDSLNGIYRRVRGQTLLEDDQWIRLGKHVFVWRYLSGVQVQTRDGTMFAASPNPGYWAKLQTALGPETFGPALAMVDDETVIGRTQGTLKLPDDPYISAAHAVIRRTSQGAVIEDLDSANGSYVDVSQAPLRDGRRFLIGQHILEFRAD